MQFGVGGRVRIAVFASGEGSNLRSIYDQIERGTLRNAELRLVVSNNSRSGALEFAREKGIEWKHISTVTEGDEAGVAGKILEVLSAAGIDLIVLAGYMKHLPQSVVEKYRDHILNIHPALLPKFGGKEMFGIRVHEAVLASGESVSGATVHRVTGNYDEGKIVLQRTCPVLPSDTPQDLQKRVLAVEHALLPEAIDLLIHSQG